jgi:hypothetical protein
VNGFGWLTASDVRCSSAEDFFSIGMRGFFRKTARGFVVGLRWLRSERV